MIVSLSLAGGEDDMGMRLAELGELATTAGARVVGEFSQSRRAPDMATYIGPGKVEDLKGGDRRLAQADLVIFDDELSRRPSSATSAKALQLRCPRPDTVDSGYFCPARPHP